MELRLDFATDDRNAGFRLEHFEFYNWGTFDKKIVKLHLSKENALLTGDIGSGKSTIVDAITTLLVPHQKITYNKAAGATTKERTLYSYIVGEYKSTQDENFGYSKAISLRDENSFSVILGRFDNVGFSESITLAQFFYISQKKVHKFFVVSKGKLSIKKDFMPKFDDIRTLKKRLRSLKYTEVFDSFSDYFKYFGREMGLKNEQALNLFYQTVSLKSIGNLTEFIRVHMLEDSKIDNKIDEICLNFATLNHTHNLVLEAMEQIKLLKPIKKEYEKYLKNSNSHTTYISMRNHLNLYLSYFESKLIKTKLEELNIQKSKSISQQKLGEEMLERLNDNIIELKGELQKNGADRINVIEKEIKQLFETMQRVKRDNETYNSLIKSLNFQAVSNEHRFLKTYAILEKELEEVETKKITYQNSINADEYSLRRYKEELEELNIEIIYLQNNPSNIPQKVSKIRNDMAKKLDIDTSELPFIGELIEVKDEKWNGAIERILHSSALSLLVDKKYYDKVSEYVDKTNLRGKLIYLKVDTQKEYNPFRNETLNSLLDKIEIKVDTPYFDVVKNFLYERFDIPCVDSLNDFKRFKKALSIHGQFKTNFIRHEKDDRYDINDKSRWVLGWDNLSKLKEFQKQYQNTKQKSELISNRIVKIKQKQKELEQRRDSIRDALKYDNFDKINWYRYSKEIDKLNNEKEELQKSNNIIKTLKNRLEEVQIEYRLQRKNIDEVISKIGKLNEQIEQKEEKLNSLKLLQENKTINDELKKSLDNVKEEVLKTSISLNNINTAQTKLREFIQSKIDNFASLLRYSSEKIAKLQSTFINAFPVISKEFSAGVNYSEEFIKKLDELQKDNLPKWRKKFKQLLKENTIRDIVMLQTILDKNAKEIKQKIETINKSLCDIEYNDGTYIELLAQNSNIADIKEFKQSLKQITTGAIDENNEYDESKFLQIKELIMRFNGREGHSDVDKKWRKLVTDVRNWYDFSAVEKYISDDSIKEYYAHSGGKSGGQKEKLAYTVLASSLAYQFGLEHDKIQSRSFRFVMIDEAFGRGSDESSRYALRLFEKLKLQLLVITPKQKINVIEPFVKSVHFVYNKDGMDSSLISLSIQEYIKNKKND